MVYGEIFNMTEDTISVKTKNVFWLLKCVDNLDTSCID